MTLTVFTIAIGNYSPAKYSLPAWEKWCVREECDFHVISQSLVAKDLPNIFNKYAFSLLPYSSKSQYHLYVDADTLPSFKLTQNILIKEFLTRGSFIGMVEDRNGLGWIDDSLRAYSEFFPNLLYRWHEYYNAGLVLFDNNGQLVANKFLDFATENSARLAAIREDHRSRGISIGSDQSLWNLYLQNYNIPTSPFDERFNLGHLQRKDVLRAAKFLNLGLIYHFNGLNPSVREELMSDAAKFHKWI